MDFASDVNPIEQIERSWNWFERAASGDPLIFVLFLACAALVFAAALLWFHIREGGERTRRTDHVGESFAELGVSTSRETLNFLREEIANLRAAQERERAEARRNQRKLEEEMRDQAKSHADALANLRRDYARIKEEQDLSRSEHQRCLRQNLAFKNLFSLVRARAENDLAASMDVIMSSMDESDAI